MPDSVSTDAERLAVEFCEEWSKRLNFRFPLAFVEDLAIRVDKALDEPIEDQNT